MGYHKRLQPIKGILIHSTNNPKGDTTYNGELAYLYNSRDVAAHYVVGEREVTELLPPKEYVAYHAGNVRDPKYSNAQSIGIEVHYSPKDTEQPISKAKIDNLTHLVKMLLDVYNLNPNDISMHRREALPLGRKQDPSFWSDLQFDTWRKNLLNEGMIVSHILNGPQFDIIVLHRALNKYAPNLPMQEKESIACAFTTYGELTTIGNLYPFVQSAKETNWFTSDKWVKNRNSAGLGATNDGAEGYKALSIADGILRQYAHLLCYAVVDEQLNDLQKVIARLSPRRNQLIATYGLGAAGNRWQGLSKKWAFPGEGYGESILERAEIILKL